MPPPLRIWNLSSRKECFACSVTLTIFYIFVQSYLQLSTAPPYSTVDTSTWYTVHARKGKLLAYQYDNKGWQQGLFVNKTSANFVSSLPPPITIAWATLWQCRRTCVASCCERVLRSRNSWSGGGGTKLPLGARRGNTRHALMLKEICFLVLRLMGRSISYHDVVPSGLSHDTHAIGLNQRITVPCWKRQSESHTLKQQYTKAMENRESATAIKSAHKKGS